jgi:NADH-quinone oxidoreductase subunit J
MNGAFYVSAVVAVAATIMTITRLNAMHALLYMVVSLFAVAVVFYVLGAPFAAVLEVIVYAGAIMVLFVFVIMMLVLGGKGTEQEQVWLSARMWTGPAILAAVLFAELVYVLAVGGAGAGADTAVEARSVGAALFGPYLLAVEIASMLLLAGLVGAFRLARGLASRESAAERESPAREAADTEPVRT